MLILYRELTVINMTVNLQVFLFVVCLSLNIAVFTYNQLQISQTLISQSTLSFKKILFGHIPCSNYCFKSCYLKQLRGWSGGAMVLGKLPVPGRPANLDYSRARA